MKTVTDLMNKFGGYRELAVALDTPSPTVAAWKHRGVIPAQHFPAIVAKAKERKIRGISLESLYRLEPDTKRRAKA